MKMKFEAKMKMKFEAVIGDERHIGDLESIVTLVEPGLRQHMYLVDLLIGEKIKLNGYVIERLS